MKLKIKKNDYGLRIYCTKCKKQYNYHNNLCNHYENQSYKSLVTIGDKRRTKTYQTKDYDKALRSAIQFKNDVKNGVVDNITIRDEVNPDNISIIEAANMFIKFKYGIDVPEHLKQNLTTNHLGTTKQAVQQLIDVLRENGVDVETTNIKDLNDNHVGFWYKFIIKKYAEGSYPSMLKMINCFINHMINHVGVLMRNPFKKVKFNPVKYDTNSITKKEFYAVLDAVDIKTPYKQLGGKGKEVKNNYKPYLKDGFKLALFTGLRREELVTLSWNDLFFSEKNGSLMFVIDNLKVERITGKQYKNKFIPVGPDLMDLLMELGYEDLKESDLFILAPNRKVKYTTIMACLSKGFSHYYEQAFPEVTPRKFKVLRKTYLSYLNKSAGDDMIELSSHGSMRVLNKHYVDAEVVAKGLTMKIWG
ncbi:hypothetical protein VOI54_03800 [Tamlana sp. 2201CG12-4]|uniref:hypothetical protein n=1 Tax=Tamlana sp. 2201CG12-4 TaxID=3112582 RepID=UPI002DBD3989|nr:hypothetical protein [Tamlana sp. 2201CG12-4]MEC3906127.1 hypothetical protein [Tamlana sp. 2201CG12-4]